MNSRQGGVSVLGCALVWSLVTTPLSGQIVVGPTRAVRSLTEAVHLAAPGTEIIVDPGTYSEPQIIVDRPVVILGRGWPVLDGGGQHEIMTVIASGVKVRGLVFRNVGVSYIEDRAGIRVSETRDCVIEGNRFLDAFFAVYLAHSRACLIRGNEIIAHARTETAAGNGIHLWHSDSIRIIGNRIRGQRDGIYFEFVHDSDIEHNLSTENLRYGLHFMFSNGCQYRRNVFRHNGAGVAVMFSNHVVMHGNVFEDNRGGGAYGLLLREITDSRLDSNTFVRNTVGLDGDGASRVMAVGNAFLDNGWGLHLMASSTDDRFVGNAFIGNSFDVITNSQEMASPFDSNYWDAYRGYDLEGAGVGDVPFHPERLSAEIVDAHSAALLLLRSPLLRVLDAAERALPVLTPQALIDPHPLMRAPALAAPPLDPVLPGRDGGAAPGQPPGYQGAGV